MTSMFGLQELEKAGIVSWQKPYRWEPIKEGPHVQTPQVRPAEDVSIQTEPSHTQQPPQVHEQSVPESQRRHCLLLWSHSLAMWSRDLTGWSS
ncbi:hypothetical protein Hdeb2414_s0004g00148701 [Helianthus debilis subsp. tardiflorus]